MVSHVPSCARNVLTRPEDPLTESQLVSICQSSLDDPIRAHGLTLRKVRKIGHRKDIEGFFGEALPGKVSPTSPTYLAAPAAPVQQQQGKKTNRASMSSVMSALGVTLGQSPAPIPEQMAAAAPPVVKSPSSGSFLASRGKKMYNFFGHRPPSELISTHLADYFPAAKRKDLERGYRNSMLRIGGGAATTTTTTTANATPGVSNRASYASSRTSSIEQNALPSRFSVASSTSSGERAASTRANAPRVSVSDDTTAAAAAAGSSDDAATRASRPASIFSTKSRRRKSHIIPGRDRRQSATPSMLTVDEITAEFEQRRASVITFAESEQEAEEAAARFGNGGVGPGGGGTAHRVSKAYPGGLPPQPESEEEEWDEESFEESEESEEEETEEEEAEEEEEEVEDEQGKAFTSTGGEHAAFRLWFPMLTLPQTSDRSNGSRAP